MIQANPRVHGRAPPAVSHGRVLRAEGPSANSPLQTESAVRQVIVCVADLLIVLNNGPDAGGALAVLSL